MIGYEKNYDMIVAVIRSRATLQQPFFEGRPGCSNRDTVALVSCFSCPIQHPLQLTCLTKTERQPQASFASEALHYYDSMLIASFQL